MNAIIFTKDQRDNVYRLLNKFYDASPYGSYKNFKTTEGRNIALSELKNDLFALSTTVMTDVIYKDLIEFIFSNMSDSILIREIMKDEMPTGKP